VAGDAGTVIVVRRVVSGEFDDDLRVLLEPDREL